MNIDMLSSLIDFTSDNIHVNTINLENIRLNG